MEHRSQKPMSDSLAGRSGSTRQKERPMDSGQSKTYERENKSSPRPCRHCGQSFQPQDRHSLWCSQECHAQYFSDSIDFPCSDVFRDHFHAQGLTYSAHRRHTSPTADNRKRMLRYSDDRPVQPTLEIERLHQENGKLRHELNRVVAQHSDLRRKSEVAMSDNQTFNGIPDAAP